MSMENADMFWSEERIGFEQRGGTPTKNAKE